MVGNVCTAAPLPSPIFRSGAGGGGRRAGGGRGAAVHMLQKTQSNFLVLVNIVKVML